MKPPVLVVDDDPNIRATAISLLTHRGYQVVEAEDGTDCLERAQAGFRGVILMDIMMPKQDGWSTIRAMVREDLTRGSLICMLTVIRAPGSAGEGLEGAVFDYLPKPFDGDELMAMVDNAAAQLAEAG